MAISRNHCCYLRPALLSSEALPLGGPTIVSEYLPAMGASSPGKAIAEFPL
jgi:hypothetical protein